MTRKIFSIVLMLFVMTSLSSNTLHPIFMSVTEIEHNAREKSLEINCKIFTNDLEAQLKKDNKEKIDLLNPAMKSKMNVVIEKYLQNHLRIAVNDNVISKMKFIGFEQNEDAIVSYLEVDGVSSVKKIKVENSILYEFSNQQINLIHVIVNGNRKSFKLDNPDNKAVFNF